MTCKARYGISIACGDLLFPGGMDSDFYVGYISDLSVKFDITQQAVISSISLNPGAFLYKFSGTKFAHRGDWEFGKGVAQNGYIVQRLTVALIPLSTADDVEVQYLLQAQDTFVVAKNNNGSYLIFGAGNGLASEASVLGSTGQVVTDNIADMIVLSSAEKTKPLRFLVGSEQGTLNYLNALTSTGAPPPILLTIIVE